VAAVHDLRGEGAARRLRWPLLAAGVAFYAAAQLLGGAFIVFVAYEGGAMLAALAVYVTLAVRRRLPGAGLIAGGILLNLAAAAIQATTLRADLVVPLDHNGLFHVVQGAALLVLLAGIGADAPARVTPSGSS
jgi:predicted phage tail protein